MKNNSIKTVTQISILLALALTIKLLFSPIFMIWGSMVRLNVSAVFSQLIPILFGPFWGSMSNGMLDLLAFFIRPQGAWLPYITALEIFSGMLLGLLWRYMKIDDRLIKALVVIAITDVLYTTLNTYGLILFIPSMRNLSFLLALVPRLAMTILLITPKAYAITLFLKIYETHIKKDLS